MKPIVTLLRSWERAIPGFHIDSMKRLLPSNEGFLSLVEPGSAEDQAIRQAHKVTR